MEQHSAIHRGPDSCDFRLSSTGSHLHSQSQNRGLVVQFSFRIAALFAISFATTIAPAATIFESGMLGPTEVLGADVFNQIVLGGNVNASLFVGARFEIGNSAKVTHIGGHFVLAPELSTGKFFGALVRLDSSADFPDSSDLSTADVVAVTTLDIPANSANVLGEINATIGAGWYSVVFGSGLFETIGYGAALRNNTAIGDPDHIGFMSGFNWVNLPNDLYFSVLGELVPEPNSLVLLIWSAICVSQRSSRPVNAPVGLDRM